MSAELLRQIEIALANMVSYQSSGNSPSIHEYGQARRTLEAVRAAQSPPQPLACTRSHPHEDMSPMCELRTVIARLENEKARAAAPVRGLPLTGVDWVAVGRILEAQQRLRGIHSTGTSNWGAAIWKAAHGIGTTAPGGDGEGAK